MVTQEEIKSLIEKLEKEDSKPKIIPFKSSKSKTWKDPRLVKRDKLRKKRIKERKERKERIDARTKRVRGFLSQEVKSKRILKKQQGSSFTLNQKPNLAEKEVSNFFKGEIGQTKRSLFLK